jgi:hypothetical protein
MLNKPTFAVLVLFVALGSPVFAKTITDEKSGISIDLPDGEGWKVEDTKTAGEKTTTATNAEGVTIIIMRFERTLPAVVLKRLADSFNPIMTDAKASDDSEGQIAVHGIQADKISGNATKDEKPIRFAAVLVGTGNNSTLAVIAFGSETPFKRHLRDIDAALGSVRPKQ